MLKHGIVTLEELRRCTAKPAGRLHARIRRTIYVGLYEEAATLPAEEADRLQEAVLDLFVTANGAFKRTSRARFPSFDALVVRHATEILGPRPAIRVHDLAVSDARTACDFFDALRAPFAERLDFFASDFCVRVFALSRRGGRVVVVVDDESRPLQIVAGRFVLPIPKREGWLFPVNRLLGEVLLRTRVPELIERSVKGDPSIERREILLVCPRARDYVAREPAFHLDAFDLMKPSAKKFEIVRAMNVLNRSYFEDAQLALAISHITSSLEEGGLLVTGSNLEAGSGVRGSIYRREGGQLRPVDHSGEGSPIRDLIG